MDKHEYEDRIRHLANDINTGHLPMETRTNILQYGVSCYALLGLGDIQRAGMNRALMGDAEDVIGDALAVWSDKLAMAQDREVSELGKVLREFAMSGYRFSRATFPLEGLLRKLGYRDEQGQEQAAYG